MSCIPHQPFFAGHASLALVPTSRAPGYPPWALGVSGDGAALRSPMLGRTIVGPLLSARRPDREVVLGRLL